MNKKQVKPLPTLEVLRRDFNYDAETGVVVRLTGKWSGRRADHLRGKGRIVKHEGVNYEAHRLIWKWVTGKEPEDQIDHENRIRGDNRWKNLRPATYETNRYNTKWALREGGIPRGVYKHGKGWRVQFTLRRENKIYYKGYDFKEACRIAVETIKVLHGDYYCPQELPPVLLGESA